MKTFKALATVAMISIPVTGATAQQIVHKFVNPSFGGPSFNSAHLLGLAEIQKQHQDPAVARAAQDPAARAQANFLRRLEDRLLNNVTNEIFEVIEAGEVGIRTFQAAGQEITVTIADNGTTTIRTVNISDPTQFQEVVIQNPDALDAGLMTTN